MGGRGDRDRRRGIDGVRRDQRGIKHHGRDRIKTRTGNGDRITTEAGPSMGRQTGDLRRHRHHLSGLSRQELPRFKRLNQHGRRAMLETFP